MAKCSFLFLFLCMAGIISNAQNEEIKARYKDVSEEELKMKFYDKDSSAEAVVLYEEGNITFDVDFSSPKIVFKYYARIKILKKSGLNRGIISIPFYKVASDKWEGIIGLEGATYNLENGEITRSKLKKDAIFKEHVMDREYIEKITMPALKVGSVFEYRYTKETPFSIGNTPNPWYFQTSIPMQWSEVNIRIPAPLNYRILKKGYIPFHTSTHEAVKMQFGSVLIPGTDYHLSVKDAPAFHDEPFITDATDYISKIDFELISYTYPDGSKKGFTDTWEHLTKSLLKSKKYEATLKNTDQLVSEIAYLKTLKDSQQQLKEAFDYVAKQVKWDYHTTVFVRQDPYEVFSTQSGSVTEINLMLVVLLREIGFEADPLILSTRENGNITTAYPSLDQFNYTVACVRLNGEDILMDATDPLLKVGMLPEYCLNDTGRVINEKSGRFVAMKPTYKRTNAYVVRASMNVSKSEWTGSIQTVAGGYEALHYRKLLKKLGEEGCKKQLKNDNPEWQIENYKLENKDNTEEEIKYEFEFASPENLANKVIYFNPIITGRVKSNPFNQKKRLYPIDLITPSDHIYMATFIIPDGYTVDEIPKSKMVVLPDQAGKFIYNIEVQGKEVKVSSRIILNSHFFNADAYEALKNFYDLIIQKHAEPIVLKK